MLVSIQVYSKTSRSFIHGTVPPAKQTNKQTKNALVRHYRLKVYIYQK